MLPPFPVFLATRKRRRLGDIPRVHRRPPGLSPFLSSVSSACCFAISACCLNICSLCSIMRAPISAICCCICNSCCSMVSTMQSLDPLRSEIKETQKKRKIKSITVQERTCTDLLTIVCGSSRFSRGVFPSTGPIPTVGTGSCCSRACTAPSFDCAPHSGCLGSR